MAQVARSSRKFRLGERVELEVSAIAHGGASIARLDGWVFFLRYAIPGERVIAEITAVGKSFHRADAVEIITASADRVRPACRYFHPGGCGGCDFQHISLERQRELKSQVITEQFKRLAKIDIEVPVHEVPTEGNRGYRYRTRLTLHAGRDGRAGFRKARSHEVVPIDDCMVVSEEVQLASFLERKYANGDEVQIPDALRIEHVHVRGKTYEYQVSPDSFWQGHRKAAEVLGSAVLDVIAPRAGEYALDLYGGVGLFGKLLADSGMEVSIIEGSESAVRDGITNVSEFASARYFQGDVRAQLEQISSADVVLLDPPRTGAEHEVLQKVVSLAPRVICYISCDPASLARDAARLAQLGYQIASASAYDLFPQTAHIECIFTFTRVIS